MRQPENGMVVLYNTNIAELGICCWEASHLIRTSKRFDQSSLPFVQVEGCQQVSPVKSSIMESMWSIKRQSLSFQSCKRVVHHRPSRGSGRLAGITALSLLLLGISIPEGQVGLIAAI